jgi:hypothetical protein
MKIMSRVYMRFERVLGVWRVSFTPLGNSDQLRDLTFSDRQKIEDLAGRAGALRDLATKQALEVALRNGLGGIELKLSREQFDKLRVRTPARAVRGDVR